MMEEVSCQEVVETLQGINLNYQKLSNLIETLTRESVRLAQTKEASLKAEIETLGKEIYSLKLFRKLVTWMAEATEITEAQAKSLVEAKFVLADTELIYIDDLNLMNLPVTELPSELRLIEGNLYAEGSQLRSLPEGLHIAGNCYVQHTEVKKFPPGLRVDGAVGADKAVCRMTEIPIGDEAFSIQGNLRIYHGHSLTSAQADDHKDMIRSKGQIGGEIYFIRESRSS